MRIQPGLEDFLQLTKKYCYVPVWTEVFEDALTPVAVVHRVGQERVSYLLESVEGGEHIGRFSFLGLDPLLTVQVDKQGKVVIKRGQKTIEKLDPDPFAALEELYASFQGPIFPELPRFYGGLVGYIGYDAVEHLEEISIEGKNTAFPQIHFVLAEQVIIFDHVFKKSYMVSLVDGKEGKSGYFRAIEKLKNLNAALLKPVFQNLLAQQSNYKYEVLSNFTKEEFISAVNQAKEYIRAGDILQVVLSQRLEVKHNNKPFNIYRALRSINPSPYLYYISQGDFQIIGSSPEMLVRVEQDVVETRPIAGTRPRGKTTAEDSRLAEELLAHPKERAEHIMLVDLGRNDLGKVCEFGTVKVTELMSVEKFSHVMHLVSTVQGELCPEFSPLKALMSCFPAGTVSGAPKVRAMQIIAELEPEARGIYAGAVCYLGLNNTLDSCITIRTIINKANTAYVQAGAGIVADSEPEKEYQETYHKAMGLLKAIAKGEEELHVNHN